MASSTAAYLGLVIPAGAWWILPVLSLPHVYYAVLWYDSEKWLSATRRLLGDRHEAMSPRELGSAACHYMANAAHLLKMIQFAALLAWCSLYAPQVLSVVGALAAPAWQLVLGASLCAAGQALNVGIYRAIGKNGVYYGNVFGATLGPWATGFPFNVPGPAGRHPQYFGVLLTIAGMAVIACHTPHAFEAGIPSLALMWYSFYLITGIIEQSENTKRKVE